jgi:hypothetical protein
MRWARIAAVVGVVTGLAVAAAAAAPPARAASANVAALQVALRALGLYPAAIDGISGRLTRRGIRRFQRHRRLVVDGIAGPRTRHALGRRGRPRLGSRPMRMGLRGWDVAALQFLLNARGYGPGGFDGGFGPNTRRALVRFQRAAGLAVDGVAGPVSRFCRVAPCSVCVSLSGQGELFRNRSWIVVAGRPQSRIDWEIRRSGPAALSRARRAPTRGAPSAPPPGTSSASC